MNDQELPIDLTKHALYSKKAKRCVLKLLRRYYDEKTAEALWEKIQLKYVEFLKDVPALGGLKLSSGIYDPILIFAWYVTVPDQPKMEEIQQDIYDCFMSGFDVLGKFIDLNRAPDQRIANHIFKRVNALREKELGQFPASFEMKDYAFERETGIIRYCFTQCPNAEFARRHNLEKFLPVMCNCDHLALKKLHAALIREGTCITSDCCDFCIVPDQNPLASESETIPNEDGLLLSRKIPAEDPEESAG